MERQSAVKMLVDMHEAYSGGVFYADIQQLIMKYTDLSHIMKRWETQRIFDSRGVMNLLESLRVFSSLERIFCSTLPLVQEV